MEKITTHPRISPSQYSLICHMVCRYTAHIYSLRRPQSEKELSFDWKTNYIQHCLRIHVKHKSGQRPNLLNHMDQELTGELKPRVLSRQQPWTSCVHRIPLKPHLAQQQTCIQHRLRIHVEHKSGPGPKLQNHMEQAVPTQNKLNAQPHSGVQATTPNKHCSTHPTDAMLRLATNHPHCYFSDGLIPRLFFFFFFCTIK